jgi:hypothetical protein
MLVPPAGGGSVKSQETGEGEGVGVDSRPGRNQQTSSLFLSPSEKSELSTLPPTPAPDHFRTLMEEAGCLGPSILLPPHLSFILCEYRK